MLSANGLRTFEKKVGRSVAIRKIKLSLHQEIALLALRDKQGTFQTSGYLHAIAGAMLAELALQNRISIGTDNSKLVTVTDAKPTGDDVLDNLLGLISTTKINHGLAHWILKSVVNRLHPHKQIAQQLCSMKILSMEDLPILWVFNRKIYPEVDAKHERALKNRMSKLMFGQTTNHDVRTTILVAIAQHTGLLKPNFKPERLDRNKNRIARIAKGELYSARNSKSAGKAMQSVVSVATSLPSMIGTG